MGRRRVKAAPLLEDLFSEIRSFDEVLSEIKAELEARAANQPPHKRPRAPGKKKKGRPVVGAGAAGAADDDDAFLDSMIQAAQTEGREYALDLIHSIRQGTATKKDSSTLIGDVRRVLEYMQLMPENEEVQLEASWAIEGFLSSRTLDVLYDEGAAELALRAIGTYPTNLVLVRNLFQLLFGIATVGRKAKTADGQRVVYLDTFSFKKTRYKDTDGSMTTRLSACDACDGSRAIRISRLGGIDLALQIIRCRAAHNAGSEESWARVEFEMLLAIISFLLRMSSVDALKAEILKKGGLAILDQLFESMPLFDELTDQAQTEISRQDVDFLHKLLAAVMKELHEWFYGLGTWRPDFDPGHELDPATVAGMKTERFQRGVLLKSLRIGVESTTAPKSSV